jgi:segregation and condensation protein A
MTYKVDLDVYSGPMDLLLYLIKREEVDIREVELARIADQYVAYLDLLKDLDIELAGDFIVMAATLLELKSRALLPRPPAEEGEQAADDEDPRDTLIRQLIEYRQFKDAAALLGDKGHEMARRFPRDVSDGFMRGTAGDAAEAVPENLFAGVELWDLFQAFSDIVRTLGYSKPREVVYDDMPIEEAARQLLARLEAEKSLLFTQLFADARNVNYMVSMFLAILELMRQRKIGCEQKQDFREIRLYLRDPASEQYVQKTPKGARESAEAIERGHARRPTVRQRERVEQMMEDADLEKTEFDAILDSIRIPDVEAYRPIYSEEELTGQAAEAAGAPAGDASVPVPPEARPAAEAAPPAEAAPGESDPQSPPA